MAVLAVMRQINNVMFLPWSEALRPVSKFIKLLFERFVVGICGSRSFLSTL